MSTYKKQFISGVLYISVAKYAGVIVSIVISAILARLLSPSDFGIIAVASVFISLANLLTDFGFAPAIIQKDNITDTDYESLFTVTGIMGIAGCFILSSLAHFISTIYENNKILEIAIYLLSINVIFSALNIIPNALLLKNKRFKLVAIRTLCMQVLSGIIAIVLAFGGLGIYALIGQSLISSFGILLYNYFQNPIKPTFIIQKSALKKVFSFSLYQFVSGLINYFQKVIDRPIVGKFMSLSSLGYYEKSWRLMMLPVQNLSYVFTPVMQPIFKDFSDNMVEMECKFGKLLTFVSIVAFPLSAYLYFASNDLILIFYGEQWLQAVKPLQYLSLSAFCYILLSVSGPIYLASNHFKLTPIVSTIELVTNLVSIFIGVGIGTIDAVAYCLAIGAVIRFIILFSIIYTKIFEMSIFQFLKHISIGVLAGIITYAIMMAISKPFNEGLSILRLILLSLFVVLIIVITIQYSKTLNIYQYVVKYIRELRKRN